MDHTATAELLQEYLYFCRIWRDVDASRDGRSCGLNREVFKIRGMMQGMFIEVNTNVLVGYW